MAVPGSIPHFGESMFSNKISTTDNAYLTRAFLWGGDGDNKKIPWVSWADLCKDTSEGGLGFKDVGMFNQALIGKWVWRVLTEKNRLWTRILRSRYGSFEGTRERVERRKNYKEGGACGDFKKIIGSGSDTKFWEDGWIEDVCLKNKFERLFRLSEQKESYIEEMRSWVNGVWEWDFRWIRPLSTRNLTSFNEMLIFLDRNKLQQRQVDHWEWIHEHKGQYEVNKAYKIIQARKKGTDTSCRERKSYNKLWKSWAIRKATSTTWKILRNRAATTGNLERRGISFSRDELKCKFCKAQAESISYLFFTCPFSVQLWNKLLNWLGICSALHEDPTKHWLQFGLCLGGDVLRKATSTIWIAIGTGNVDKEFCSIKSQVWNWMYCKEKRLAHLNLSKWVDNPISCLECLN
ncbi:hypothetical protein ACS0TY_002529 [Phlomoides rotata]